MNESNWGIHDFEENRLADHQPVESWAPSPLVRAHPSSADGIAEKETSSGCGAGWLRWMEVSPRDSPGRLSKEKRAVLHEHYSRHGRVGQDGTSELNFQEPKKHGKLATEWFISRVGGSASISKMAARRGLLARYVWSMLVFNDLEHSAELLFVEPVPIL